MRITPEKRAEWRGIIKRRPDRPWNATTVRDLLDALDRWQTAAESNETHAREQRMRASRAEAERDRLRARIEKVRVQHCEYVITEGVHTGECEWCGCRTSYPCWTRRVLDGEEDA